MKNLYQNLINIRNKADIDKKMKRNILQFIDFEQLEKILKEKIFPMNDFQPPQIL